MSRTNSDKRPERSGATHPVVMSSPAGKPSPRNNLLLYAAAFVLLTLAVVIATGAYWAAQAGRPSATPARIAAAALCAMTLTGAYVGLRWLRWYFVLRRVTPDLRARDALVLFLGTLPAAATPLAVGELVRAIPFRKRPQFAGVIYTWFVERGADLLVLLLLLVLAWRPYPTLAGVACAAAGSLLWARLGNPSLRSRRSMVPAVALLTALNWLVLWLAFWVATELLTDVNLGGLQLMSLLFTGILKGALSLLPMGIGVTPSTLISGLHAAGAPLSDAVTAITVFRGGTVWVIVVGGLFLAWALRKPLARVFREGTAAQSHFDEISDEYLEQIPEHVRSHFIAKKLEPTVALLNSANIFPGRGRGLDIGCGQALYANEMASRGFHIVGIERSDGQLRNADASADVSGVKDNQAFSKASATHLPFADASFDFAYMVNVMHHIPGQDNRDLALSEILRVLKPGGIFFLHEMNILNPLFRFYMGYVFPIFKSIDDGTEVWIRPDALPALPNAQWDKDVSYFTFIPEFLPRPILTLLLPLEVWLERSRIRHLSAHYMASFRKPAAPETRVGAA